MERQIKQALTKIVVFTCLLLLGGFLDVLGIMTGIRTLSIAYYLLLGIFFVGRLSDRIVDGRVRRLLCACAWMMVFFFFLRGMKYHAFRGLELPARILWYLYYVPTILIPFLSFLTALCVDAPRERKTSRLTLWLAAPTILMILAVLTNDFHQWVFRFQPGFINWDGDYQHGILYYLISAWILALFLGTGFVLTQKCRLSAGKKLFWIPLLPIGGGLAYVVAYALGVPPKVNGYNLIEFPEMTNFVIACFWECCISIGLIPSNKGYEKLFMASDIAAQIADKEFQTIYASGAATQLKTEQMVAKGEQTLSENVILHRADIQGGYVYWQSDVSELNRVNRELKELEERLAEETELIRLQNELAEKRAEIEEKNRVYDAIANQVLPQSQRIAGLVGETEGRGTLFERNARKICFYGTYLKRYANLMLLAENHQSISAKELGLAMEESFRALRELSVPAVLSGASDTDMPSRRAIEIYAGLQGLLEAAGEKLHGVYAVLTDKECKVTAELEGVDDPLGWQTADAAYDDQAEIPMWLTKWMEGRGPQEISVLTMEDQVLYVRFPYERGGEGA